MQGDNNVRYILNDGEDRYLFDTEMDIMAVLEATRDMLRDDDRKHVIYCLEKTKPVRKGRNTCRMYMMVNEEYETSLEVAEKIKEYSRKGFNAYSIL